MTNRPVVLVADDDPDILELIAFGLERAGYEILSARDGVEALELAGTRTPDVAVLDVMMPRMDGCELTRKLRGAEATSSMPILLLTALAEDVHAARGLAAGADAYLKKPFSPRVLAEQVRELLHGRNGNGSG